MNSSIHQSDSRLPLFLPQSVNRWSPWVSTHPPRRTEPNENPFVRRGATIEPRSVRVSQPRR